MLNLLLCKLAVPVNGPDPDKTEPDLGVPSGLVTAPSIMLFTLLELPRRLVLVFIVRSIQSPLQHTTHAHLNRIVL